MKMTKRLATLAACAVMATSSMIGMGAFATDYNVNQLSDMSDNANISVNSYSPALLNTINGWADSLYASSGFGNSLSYSSGWYNSISDVELLARLIYAEATTNSTYCNTEQIAVTWVLVNRKNSSQFPDSLRDIATQTSPIQFSSITGSSSATSNARNPVKNSAWKHAIWMSCAILSTSDTSDYMWLFGKPTGIDNQLFFYASSIATFGTSSGILTINGVKAKNVAYAGYGNVTTTSTATSISSSYRNIYYNYY